jgi:hypothetical protein
MWSHCWVYLVINIVVVTLIDKFGLILLLWVNCWVLICLENNCVVVVGSPSGHLVNDWYSGGWGRGGNDFLEGLESSYFCYSCILFLLLMPRFGTLGQLLKVPHFGRPNIFVS